VVGGEFIQSTLHPPLSTFGLHLALFEQPGKEDFFSLWRAVSKIVTALLSVALLLKNG
jgi:hypothetical protein